MPADIQNDLVEIDLITRFGWTLEYIKKLPYKWIQKFYIYDSLKNDAREIRTKMDEAARHVAPSHGNRPPQFRTIVPGVTKI